MYNRKKAPEGYYTASEAIAKIGIPSTTFYDLVKTNEIRKRVPPGRKEGYYDQFEIDLFAKTWKAIHEPYADDQLRYSIGLEEDASRIHELVASVSGGHAHAVPVDIIKGWMRKNPEAVHVLRRKADVVGYIAMFSLPMDILMKRLSGQLFNREIPIDALMTFRPDTTVPLYIAEVAVLHAPENLLHQEPNPDARDLVAAILGARLIRESLRYLDRLERQGTHVSEIYAVGTSKLGIALAQKFGLQPMDLPTGVREDRIPFCADAAVLRRLRASVRDE